MVVSKSVEARASEPTHWEWERACVRGRRRRCRGDARAARLDAGPGVGLQLVADAADGAAGVQAVAETVPDPVLLDVSMPVMDGLKALRVIRAQSLTAAVVMFSGFGHGSEVARQAVQLGAHWYIRKREKLSELVDQLRATGCDAPRRHR